MLSSSVYISHILMHPYGHKRYEIVCHLGTKVSSIRFRLLKAIYVYVTVSDRSLDATPAVLQLGASLV